MNADVATGASGERDIGGLCVASSSFTTSAKYCTSGQQNSEGEMLDSNQVLFPFLATDRSTFPVTNLPPYNGIESQLLSLAAPAYE